ncbi:hypothetical protein DXX93_15490 [Thalassotalea euphylliae]|uniref:MAPEG family protein n=1 Tax=Thalassotalea euphylliae TaxID=1655234 RepID=A0A3E0TV58_9GAMM|nr:MAPEG family protein [Thalassotalea euphylliae]REL27822.1 hypothetical protein DXX93_15490 [Thalassotalea euphylliae]
MTGSAIFFPVLAHVLLVILLFFALISRKNKAVKAKAVDLSKTPTDASAWTTDVVKVSNNIANQFETPVLFMVLCIVAFVIGAADAMMVGLAWAYVLLRYVHAYIHIGSNYVPYRMRAFAMSLLIILTMAIRLGLELAANT